MLSSESPSQKTRPDVGSVLDLAGKEADRVDHETVDVRLVDEVREDYDRLRLDGASEMDDVLVLHELRERWHRVRDGHRRRPVQDDAHRAVVPVLADEDDRAPEVRVVEPGPGDEELTAKRVQGGILARPDTGPGGRESQACVSGGSRRCSARPGS